MRIGFRLPDALIESAQAAVEVVAVIVLGEGDCLSVDGQLAAAESVGVASDGAAEEGITSDVVFEGTQAQGDFAEAAMDIGHADRGQRRAEFADRDFHAAGVRERVELDRATFDDAVLAAQGEARATGTTQGEEAGDQQGAVSQHFGGEHAREIVGR